METGHQQRVKQSEPTGVGIAGEVGAPLDVGATSMLTSSDGVEADGAQDGRVGDLGPGGDDAVGDGVVDGLEKGVSKKVRKGS